jgi:hypothetical protein
MLEWGMGRVEALAVQTEILTLLDQGYPVSRIYRDKQKSGQITMGERRFISMCQKSNVIALKPTPRQHRHARLLPNPKDETKPKRPSPLVHLSKVG